MKEWALAFGLSLALEVPVYWFVLRTPKRARACAAFGTTLLTHPYVWFVLPSLLLPSLGYWGYVIVAELAVVATETGVCIALGSPPKRALWAAALANTLSYLVGALFLY